MLVTSREYKVIVDTALFANVAAGLKDIRDDIAEVGELVNLTVDGKFKDKDPTEQSVLFLDTTDHSLRDNGLLLRQRLKLKNGKTEYTLKCRSEDRYIAAGKDLSPSDKLKPEEKSEEDIGVPFVSRFSHSVTVRVDDEAVRGENLPQTLIEASKIFPGIRSIRRDNIVCAPETPLAPVNNLKVCERIFKGPELLFSKSGKNHRSTAATVALILWSKGKKGRNVTAEFSFRSNDDNENFSPKVALIARVFFERVQQLDWARPTAMTKTQFMYGGR
jgi:hypothetical protein